MYIWAFDALHRDIEQIRAFDTLNRDVEQRRELATPVERKKVQRWRLAAAEPSERHGTARTVATSTSVGAVAAVCPVASPQHLGRQP